MAKDFLIDEYTEEIEDAYVDCDGRCLNCDYYEPITGDCRVEEN